MFYDEKLENGIWYCRTHPTGPWTRKPYQGAATGREHNKRAEYDDDSVIVSTIDTLVGIVSDLSDD